MDLSSFVPSIIRFSPTIADLDVPVLPSIVIEFSTELDVSQISDNAALNGLIMLIEETTDAPRTVVFQSYASRVLTFKPATALIPGSTYLLTVLGGVRSPEGRTMGVPRSWAFKTQAGALTQPVLSAPSNLSAVSSLPTLSWSAATSSTSGAITYLVELDVTPEFASVNTQGWSTTTSNLSTAIGTALASKATYWWRVTPIQNAVKGPYSNRFAFYLGTFATPSPDSQVLYSASQNTFLSSSGFTIGDTNLLTWPMLTMTFSSALDPSTISTATVTLQHAPVDGYVEVNPGTTNISVTGVGSTLTITPLDALLFNSRYTITLKGVKDIAGNLINIAPIYFTSKYNPLYIGAVVLRANFGALLDNVSDDFLNFHIFRVSLDVNRHWIRMFSQGVYLTGPTAGQVRNATYQLTYGMERWVEHEAGARVLQEYLRQRLINAGQNRTLGDYEESSEVALISELKQAVAQERKEALYWIAEFSRKRARMATARKSERYVRERLNTDYSRINREKGMI